MYATQIKNTHTTYSGNSNYHSVAAIIVQSFKEDLRMSLLIHHSNQEMFIFKHPSRKPLLVKLRNI